MKVKRLIWPIFTAVGAVLILTGESKSEAYLRQQLEASEKTRLADHERLTAALATIARSGSQGKTAQTSAEISAKSAQISAQGAQETADYTASTIQQAAIAAATAAAVAQSQASQFQAISRSNNTVVLITQCFGFGGVLLGFLYKAWSDGREHHWKTEADRQQHELVMNKLEAVKTSADSAYNEANTVNRKIASIGVEMRDKMPLNPDK